MRFWADENVLKLYSDDGYISVNLLKITKLYNLKG